MVERINCTLAIVASALDVANQGGDIETVGTMPVIIGCGVMGSAPAMAEPITGCSTNRGNSFTAGTPVATELGARQIEDLRIGDWVLARDDRTGETRAQRVTDILQHVATDGVVRLTLQRVPDPRQTLLLVDGGQSETLGVTAEHPIRVVGRGWVLARDLRPGDRVEARNGVLQVLATGVDLRMQPVYNLSVESDATYFAGDLGAWVHNEKSSTSGNNGPASKGQQMHKFWNWGTGFATEQRLPSGARVDAINWTTGEVCELKPNNPRAIRRGIAQLRRYLKELNSMGNPVKFWTNGPTVY
jgi:Restriction endonuclease fold toxin 9/Pretoxin HINT domain